MQMRRLLSVCSLAVAVALGTVSTGSAKTFPLGVLTTTDPLSQSVEAPAGTVNDQFSFDFTVTTPLAVYANLVNGYTQDNNHHLATGLLSSDNPASYIELFSGTPTGLHAAVPGSLKELIFNGSSQTVTATTQTFNLGPGDYYLELMTSAPGKAGLPPLTRGGADFTVGVFGAAVPEPATWAMLITGVAMIGFAARRRRDALAAAAC
jgi:hypothetical protein